MKICKSCGEEKELTEFYSNGYQPNGAKKYKASCKSCTEDAVRGRKENYIDEILEELGLKLECELCGYNKNRAALCFHHMDEEDKDFQISGNNTRSKAALKEEIEKCALVCHNCHMEIHHPHKSLV